MVQACNPRTQEAKDYWDFRPPSEKLTKGKPNPGGEMAGWVEAVPTEADDLPGFDARNPHGRRRES